MNKIDLIIDALETSKPINKESSIPFDKHLKALAAAKELRHLQWENLKLWETNAELLEGLKLAYAIIGPPDDQGSEFIAATIAKAEKQA